MKLNNKTKKFKMITKIGVIIIPVLALVFISTTLIGKASALENLTDEQIGIRKQNVLYKAIYQNLKKCYTQMKTPIEQSSTNTNASYDSDTYFTSESRANTYLKFPNGVGDKNESSCPGMILGWNTSWLVNLFTKTGDYDGLANLNKDAVVPGTEDDWKTPSSTNKMGKFLKDIGYTEEVTHGGLYDGEKCFYIKADITDTYRNAIEMTPIHGYTFETFDYCVTLNSDGKLYPGGNNVGFMKGKTEMFDDDYDEGHVTDETNLMYIQYDKFASYPLFKYFDKDFSADSGSYLAATIEQIELVYQAHDSWANVDTQHYQFLGGIQTVNTKKRAQDSALCAELGYYVCGYYSEGFVSWAFGSLTAENEAVDYNTLKNRWVNLIKNIKTDDGLYVFSNVSTVEWGGETSSFKKGTSDSKYIQYFLKNVDSYNDGKFKDDERYILYWSYLKDHYDVAVSDSEVPDSIRVSWLMDDGSFAKKYIYDPDADLSDKRYVLNGSYKWDGSTQQDWEWIAKQLADIDVSKAFNVEASSIVDPDINPTTPEDAEDDGTVTNEDLCYRNAKSLGWIICPVMFGAREMADSIYNAALPLIQTNESIVGQLGSNTSGLYQAWEVFRNLANIIFVILFMFIIFSQLTGYGIDNYGIKRMLPKVIITVVLINLSYIICAIAVDAANIVGSAAKGLFETIANNVGNAVVTGSFGEAFGQICEKVIGGLAIAGTGAMIAGISIAMEGWAIVIPILIFFLTILISVLFAFIVLGMRQALVVILVVISPLAFACNMLPNTESMFKKWFETAKKILMVYPIIGAVTGVSYLTARILLSADSGFFMTLVAGILMVGPYFYIPQLVSEALDSVKSLGARIGNIGNRMRNGARNGIRNSEGVRNFAADGREAAAARRANRFLNSRRGRAIEQDLRDGKNVSSRRSRQYMRAQERANSGAKANLGAYEALLGSGDTANRLSRMQGQGFEAREAGLQDKAFEDAVSDQMALMEKTGTFASDNDFENAVFDAATKGDQARLEALMRKAAKGSDNQRARLFRGMSRAFGTGNVDKAIAGRYGAHLTSNPIYKSNDPSAYGLGTALTNAVGNGKYGTAGSEVTSFTQENYTGKRMLDGKVAPVSAFNFDDAEFDALTNNMGNFSDSQKQKLANIMQQAVDAHENDPTGQFKSVKPETIDKIKGIIAATGMTPGADAGNTLTVDHSSASADRNALDAYTESVIKRVLDTRNGGITAEEGEAMIRRAEEYYKKKHGGK